MGSSSFQIRGVIEGFYGVYYTPPERNDLIKFISKKGYNLYIYGPKNDRQHRTRWWEPYPDFVMEQFQETITLSQKHGVDFCYSIGSGVSMNYASEKDIQIIKDKFKAFYNRGVRTFAINLDDISSEFHHEEERQMFTSYAEAHVYLCNKLYEWLQGLDSNCTLMMCPTDYHGTAPFSAYILQLGEGLHAGIEIFYTGSDICTPTISESETNEFAKAAHRQPIIWDNYPVNDLAMKSEMHIGPITGRASSLSKVSKGVVVNVMIQAEASKIPLVTFSDFFKDPANYRPWDSWTNALKEIGGEENYRPLRTFAENSLRSCLNQKESERLEKLVFDALTSLKSGQSSVDNVLLQKLQDYLDELDEAGYHLKNRMTNYSLRNNLVPWIELLESWAWAGRRAIAVIQALEKKGDYLEPLKWLRESTEEVREHPKHMTGDSLLPLINYAMQKVDLT